jgi:hypothetical protein
LLEFPIKEPTMRMLGVTLGVLAMFAAGLSSAAAGAPLPAETPIANAIDRYIDARLQQEGITPAPAADDANLLRRLTLDLAGRIPTVAEIDAYLASTDQNKKAQLVDRLLTAPSFARHQADEFDVMLMNDTQGSVRDYLAKALAEDRSWDRIFREVVLTDEKDPKQKGAAEFVKQRVRDLDQLTNDVSTIFFGVNVSCAKCHDHPLVHDWKQDHFYGMKSFFSRTFDNGGYLAEHEYGVVKFKTKSGIERQARLMFLTGKTVEASGMKEPSNDEQRKEKERLEGFKKRRTPPPLPKFSARAQLVDLALQPGQRDFFARSIVNRLWLRLFGYGLVMPVDQMHSENPPSHPELLDWLARDTVGHRYDLRRLIRGMVLSRAYGRSSRWEGSQTPPPQLFAVARVRPLRPMALAVALRLATTDPASFAPTLKPEEFDRRLQGLEGSARGFTRMFEQPGDSFQVGISEALLFSNSDRFLKEFLADGGDRLVGRLKQLQDPKAVIETAVRTVLSRPARPEEIPLLQGYLSQRKDRKVAACRQVVWALLASPEFRFNY